MEPNKSPSILILDGPDLIYTEKRLCKKLIPDSNIFVSSKIKEAEEIIQTKPIDLILMDLFSHDEQKPEVTPFLSKIKEKQTRPKIIGTSGSFISHEHAEYLDKVLMKPYSIHELKRVLNESISNH